MLHHITNNGTGPHVVLVHGNSLDHTVWSEQLADPSLAHLRLIAADLPGHGRSAPYPPGRPYTLEALAADAVEQLRDLDGVTLIGHSLGGHVAMRMAAQLPAVRHIILCGAPPLAAAADAARAFLPAPVLARAFTAQLAPDDARQLAEGYTWAGCPHLDAIASGILHTDGRARAELGAQLSSGVWNDEVAMLRASGAEVHLLHGADDPFIPLPYLNEMARTVAADGKVHVIPGAGHSPQLQQPALFNAHIARITGP